MYEGEWSSGTMSGLGVRTFSTGQVKVGRERAAAAAAAVPPDSLGGCDGD